MKLGGNQPPGDNPLLFSTSGTGWRWAIVDGCGVIMWCCYKVVKGYVLMSLNVVIMWCVIRWLKVML